MEKYKRTAFVSLFVGIVAAASLIFTSPVFACLNPDNSFASECAELGYYTNEQGDTLFVRGVMGETPVLFTRSEDVIPEQPVGPSTGTDFERQLQHFGYFNYRIYYVSIPSGGGRPALLIDEDNTSSGVLVYVAGNPALPVNSDGEPAAFQEDIVRVSVSIANDPDDPPVINSAGDPIEEDDTTEEEALANCTEAGALAWITCPLISSMLKAVEGMMDLMSTLLQVTPLDTQGQDDPVYETWSFMRNFALTALAIGLMIMIFQQAVRPDTDAYLIKRMVPRLGGAAVGIIFSYYIAAILLDIFNLLGSGMQTFMEGVLDESSVGLTGSQTFADVIGKGLIAGGTLAVIASSTPVIPLLFTLLIPVIMAVVAAFVVIVIRHVLIIVLVIFSPFAFAAWILPNTEAWFKKWMSFFAGLLMMYPLVMILLGSGAIFGVIITGGGGAGSFTENNVFNYVIALMAVAISLGLIPFTIRASSSLLGRISGIVNNPNRGPIDRLRRGAQQRVDFARGQRKSERLEALRSTPDNRRFKRGGLRAMTGEFGYGSLGSRGKSYRKLHTYAAQEEAFKQQKGVEAFGLNEQLSKQSNPQEYLRREFASATSEARKSVVFEKMTEMKDLKGLSDIYTSTARSGDSTQIEALKRMNQENFGKIHEFAPQLTLSNLDAGPAYVPNWNELAKLTPEALSKLKPESVEGALNYTKTNNPAAAEQIMVNYTNTQPHMRNIQIINSIQKTATEMQARSQSDPQAYQIRPDVVEKVRNMSPPPQS